MEAAVEAWEVNNRRIERTDEWKHVLCCVYLVTVYLRPNYCIKVSHRRFKEAP